MTDLFEHFTKLAVLAFGQSDFVPGIFRLPNHADLGGGSTDALLALPASPNRGRRCSALCLVGSLLTARGSHTAVRNHQASPKLLQSGFIRYACHLDEINLGYMRRGF